MRGLEIEFKKHTDLGRFLHLNGLDLSNYKFYCIDSSVYNHSRQTDFQRVLSTNQLVEILKSKIVIERLHLQAYPSAAKLVPIVTYNDFLYSTCDMIILAYDGVFLEIYVKNQQWLNRLFVNAKNFDTEYIIIKTDDTDARKEMYV